MLHKVNKNAKHLHFQTLVEECPQLWVTNNHVQSIYSQNSNIRHSLLYFRLNKKLLFHSNITFYGWKTSDKQMTNKLSIDSVLHKSHINSNKSFEWKHWIKYLNNTSNEILNYFKNIFSTHLLICIMAQNNTKKYVI